MTRTYDDIEAVTRLLEEKEKDLELTVQIGKDLLAENNALENRISELEEDLKSTNEDRAQLLHELHKKNELIAVLTSDADDGVEGETLSKSISHDLLQKKIASLEDENKSLKMEASQLANQTDEVEAHERQLVEDITSQLNNTNRQFETLSLELERQREENRLQHEQIVSLTARLADTEMRLHQLTHDNDEHISLLNITKENQNSLALELVEFKQRYQEVYALLQETQDQLRKQRKKQQPQARSAFVSSFIQPDSLQSELMESSMFSEHSLDSGISGDNQRSNDRIGRMIAQVPGMYCSSMMSSGISTGPIPGYKKVFETVRCASKNGSYADNGNLSVSQIGSMSMSSASGPRMSPFANYNSNVHPAGSYYHDSLSSTRKRTLSTDSLTLQSDDEGYPSQPAGVPGAPGAKELEAALKRLTPAEVLARRAMLSHAPIGTYSYEDQERPKELPTGIRTPDSVLSTGSSGVSSTFMNLTSSTSHPWRLPEKLQIVKPMEGSQTLHHWSRLATPTLSGLLEERPGVTIRGGRNLSDLGMQVYTLSDVEEDVPEDVPPGKQYMTQGCTYTYTTSTVMHPDDGLLTDMSFLSQSQMSSRMASTSTSRQPSCPPTPRAGLSRKNSCSTFSVNLSLASMLNERGIKAVTPSALNTPTGANFSPTVTPCNSPEGSPTRSMSPEPMFGFLASGAELIRRTLVGDMEKSHRNQSLKQQQKQKLLLSRLEKRALRSLKLVEKVESLGLENIIVNQANAGTTGVVNRSSSPMSGLRSLNSSSSSSSIGDLHLDRSKLKSVLNKSLKSQQTNSKMQKYFTDDWSSNASSRSTSDIDECANEKGSGNSSSLQAASASGGDQAAGSQKTKQNTSDAKTGLDSSNTIDACSIGKLPLLPSASETRLKQMQRQKSRRNLKNGMAGQRPDLGTIGSINNLGRMRTDLGKVAVADTQQKDQNNGASNMYSSDSKSNKQNKENSATSSGSSNSRSEQSLTQSFVGTVSSLLFGRKGGWL